MCPACSPRLFHVFSHSLPPCRRFYVVVLANPPDTGDEEGGRSFAIDVDRVPRELLNQPKWHK